MINHVEIYVSNWKSELVFWEKISNILDIQILDKWKTGFSIGDYSTSYISFNETKSHSNFKRINVGINHIGLSTKLNKGYVDKQLIENNIKLLYLDKKESNTFIENEWGLKIEIVFSDH